MRVLEFMVVFARQKWCIGLTDVDVLVLLALVEAPADGLRFSQLVKFVGRSSTGVWNSLERLEDIRYVACCGPAWRHTYLLSDEGKRAINKLAGR